MKRIFRNNGEKVWSGFIWLKSMIVNLQITQKARDMLSTTAISHLAIRTTRSKRYGKHEGTESFVSGCDRNPLEDRPGHTHTPTPFVHVQFYSVASFHSTRS
jgi:hypothetical protein